jgi:hypothetical protein
VSEGDDGLKSVITYEELNPFPVGKSSLQPAVIKTKDAHKYVGCQPLWVRLREQYGDILLPIRETQRGDQYWLVEQIDHVLKLAQAEGTLRAA